MSIPCSRTLACSRRTSTRARRWGSSRLPTGVAAGLVRRWPCFPEARRTLEAGELPPPDAPAIPATRASTCTGVWLDDEGLPYPWNGAYFAQRLRGMPQSLPRRRRARQLRRVLSGPGSFGRACSPRSCVRRARCFRRLASAPTATRPAGTASRFRPRRPHAGALRQHPGSARRVSRSARRPRRRSTDSYAARLLRIFSESNARKSLGKLSIPYVSRFVPDNALAPAYRLGMSQRAYRELHCGTCGSGAPTPSSSSITATRRSPQIVTHEASFASVEDARAVYDELLAHRSFASWRSGTPVTFAVPEGHSRETRSGPACGWATSVSPGDAAVGSGGHGHASRRSTGRRAWSWTLPAEGAYCLLSRDGRSNACDHALPDWNAYHGDGAAALLKGRLKVVALVEGRSGSGE